MDTENLKKLQKLAKGMSLLYVEDSLTLQKQVGRFLSKIFDKFYQAYDGQDGYDKYKAVIPDILLTDLTMPKKSGLEMIVDIKEINHNAKIVVLSAHNDDVTLLQTIDLGIIDFILKPLDMDRLTNSLIEAIELSDTIKEVSKCIHDIKMLKEQNTHVEFINSYKGMPIQSTGMITDIQEDEFTVHVDHKQVIAMKYEKHTVMELSATQRHIKVHVLKIDDENDTVQFAKPEYINFTLREFKYKRIKVDNSFKIGFHNKNHTYEVQPIDVSFISISMTVNEFQTQLKLNDEIELTLGFDTNNISSFFNEKKFTKIFVKGKIIRLEPHPIGTLIVASIKAQKADESTFNKYLKDREIEILQEFKSLLKK